MFSLDIQKGPSPNGPVLRGDTVAQEEYPRCFCTDAKNNVTFLGFYLELVVGFWIVSEWRGELEDLSTACLSFVKFLNLR